MRARAPWRRRATDPHALLPISRRKPARSGDCTRRWTARSCGQSPAAGGRVWRESWQHVRSGRRCSYSGHQAAQACEGGAPPRGGLRAERQERGPPWYSARLLTKRRQPLFSAFYAISAPIFGVIVPILLVVQQREREKPSEHTSNANKSARNGRLKM